MKMLPIAIAGLIVSLLFQCSAEAQFRHGRYGGVHISIPLGGFGYGGFSPGHYGYGHHGYRRGSFGYGGFGYGGYRHPGFAPHVGIPRYPVNHYRVPLYRVPISRVPIYSVRAVPSHRYVAPRRSYVYPQPSLHRLAPSEMVDIAGDIDGYQPDLTSESLVDENSLLQSAGELRGSLSRRINDADVWLEYLDPDLIIDTVQSRGDGSRLQDLLRNYDGLSGNADLSDLWIAPGFRRTHQGLRAYVKEATGLVEATPQAQSDVAPTATPNADPQADSLRDLPADSQSDSVQELPSPI